MNAEQAELVHVVTVALERLTTGDRAIPADLPSATGIVTREDWMQHGACRGVDPALFFPDGNSPTTAAKAVCAACPVRAECLEFALRENERYGIWGGLGERDRRALRRERGYTQARILDRAAIQDDEVARVAMGAHVTGQAMSEAVGCAFGIRPRIASALISRARKRGRAIPYDYRGWVA